MNSHFFVAEMKTVFELFTILRWKKENTAMPDPALFPLFGGIVGVVLALSAWCCRILFGSVAGGLTAALILPFIYETYTGWQGLYALTSAMEMRFAGRSAEESLTSAEQPGNSFKTIVLMIILYALRMLAFGVLTANGSAAFLIFAFTGDYFLRAQIAGSSFNGEVPLFESDPARGNIPLLTITCALLAGAVFSFSLTGIAGAVASAFLIWLCKKGLDRCLASLDINVTLRTVTVLGYAGGTILLLAGMAVMR